MKIGLLAYHSACNMGATLQLLSSYGYWQKAGHEPIVINWVAQDLEDFYTDHTPKSQILFHQQLRQQLWKETDLCRTAEDIARVIEKEGIQAVVIGSDAVAQNHPWPSRLYLSRQHIVGLAHYTSDRMFPNPFWGMFNDFLPYPIPVALLSASSQDSEYHLFPQKTRREMTQRWKSLCYISTRDTWTQKMIQSVTNGDIQPQVTPDPVFAFNYNAGERIASKEDILKKYNLPEKYILLSFLNTTTVTQNWLNEFTHLASESDYTCTLLPFAAKTSFGTLPHIINLPLSPLDWYALIKYSSGYIGHNMHPLVVSIHNNVPFFSFDNYGQKKMSGLITNESSSKILHILDLAGLSDYRISCLKQGFQPPKPEFVLNKLTHFDFSKEKRFANFYYAKYQTMMSSIQHAIQNA